MKQKQQRSLEAELAIAMAERELLAFTQAVARGYGDTNARMAGEAWIEQLTCGMSVPKDTAEWRRITLNTASLLATRLISTKGRAEAS